jgi:4-amino-4-deoxy-L-arabinose transferase-like glycosyltransferase
LRTPALLLIAAALLFTANAWMLPLPAIDDCFYARKGVEMARRGPTLTVTINGEPTFQNPPLHFWILGAGFRVLGENDLAARMPSILMALGILAGVWAIGRRLAGGEVAAAAMAILILTPGFTNQARRCMLDMALTFWVTLAVLVLVEGRRRPALLPLFGVPLACAILTKSLLGLLPIALLAGIIVVVSEYRALLRRPGLWIGIAAGLLLAAVWPVHQWLAFGLDALRQHYLQEIMSRATARFDLPQILLGYPKTLLTLYEPVIVPAVVGAVLLWRRAKESGRETLVFAVWAFLPVLLYSLSSARAARYVYPTLPALALCAGYWIATSFPQVSRALSAWVAPGVALAVALIFWIRPSVLARSATETLIKQDRTVASRVPEGESIAYLGDEGRYWRLANPLIYYHGRSLDFTAATAEQALARARVRRSGLLVVDRERLDELGPAASAPVVLDGGDWRVIEVKAGGPQAAAATNQREGER